MNFNQLKYVLVVAREKNSIVQPCRFRSMAWT